MDRTKLGDLRGVVEAARRMVDDWDALCGHLDGVARESEDRRAALERLEREHQELEETHRHVRQELDETVGRLDELRAAHEVVRAERDAAASRVRELEEQCHALVQDRQFAVDQLDAILRRMKP